MPFSTQMILESCPPISRMVRTSGCKNVVPTACAVISFFTTVAPHMAATTRRAASAGLPSVHRYVRAMMRRSASMITPFVEIDPMSMPR